jgi:putative endonuclease
MMSISSTWWIYLVRCADDSLYTGIAMDVERRFHEHQETNGKGAKYLRGKGPLLLVLKMPVGARSLALKTEMKIKKLKKAQKEKLIKSPRRLKEIIQKLELISPANTPRKS